MSRPSVGSGEVTDSSLKPMRRLPKQKRGKRRVDKILEAAAEVFDEMGYEAATTHAIAIRAGTAIGSLYQFFPDKLSIFHALEALHMEQVQTINTQLFSLEMAQLPLEQIIGEMVKIYADYFENPMSRVVYVQYFVAPEIFRLFDEKFNRGLIQATASWFRLFNPDLSLYKSELLAEVTHQSYNALLLVALRSKEPHRKQLYAEIKDLLVAYLRPYAAPDVLHKKVMKCPHCHSEHVSKNGHRHGKQRYLCRDCRKQFPDTYIPQGYSEEVKQHCLELHMQGIGFREIERTTGISHNTIIHWVKHKKEGD
jgi:transposase-like protein/AcrR family transcriptional regulator